MKLRDIDQDWRAGLSSGSNVVAIGALVLVLAKIQFFPGADLLHTVSLWEVVAVDQAEDFVQVLALGVRIRVHDVSFFDLLAVFEGNL